MSDGAVTNPSIDRAEHDSTESAKRVLPLGWNGAGTTKMPIPFLTKPFDELAITYTDNTKNTISSIISKLGGITQETITNTSTATSDDFVRS